MQDTLQETKPLIENLYSNSKHAEVEHAFSCTDIPCSTAPLASALQCSLRFFFFNAMNHKVAAGKREREFSLVF